MMEKLQNYIGGRLMSPLSDQYFENFEPAKGSVYSLIPDSDEKDIALATEAAKSAFASTSFE